MKNAFIKKKHNMQKKELWILNMKVKGRRKEKGKHIWVKRWKNCDRVCRNICKFIFANALQFIKKKKGGSFVTKMINSAIEYERKLKLPSYQKLK